MRSSAIACGGGLREVVRLSAALPQAAGHDYVLIGRRAALDLPFERMIAELRRRPETSSSQARPAVTLLKNPDMTDNKNTILAIVLPRSCCWRGSSWSACRRWRRQRQQAQQQQQQQAQKAADAWRADAGPPAPRPGTAPVPERPSRGAPQAGASTTPGGQVYTRETVLAASRASRSTRRA
jgi:hypothetical protein